MRKNVVDYVSKNRHVCSDQREAVKEGDTYGEEIELRNADVEVIPSKIMLSGEETMVVFDLETTGKFYFIFKNIILLPALL